MSSTPLRIGVVGLDHWYWAFSLAEAVRGNDAVELVAVADADRERAEDYASRFGIESLFTDFDQVIGDKDIDAVASLINCEQNPQVCIAAAQAGKHILSVKPIARTLEQASELRAAVHEAGVVFLSGESANRTSAQSQQLKEWVNDGKLGRIVNAAWNQHAGLPQRWPGDNDSGWFLDPALAPGGGWIDHSIYHIDLMRWLLDDEISQISGYAGRIKYPDLAFEDYGVATILFNNGAVLNDEVTWLAPAGGGRTSWTITGSEGAVAQDSLTGRLSVVGDFPPFKGWIHSAPSGRSTEWLNHFVACIRGDETPIATVDDSWRNLAACLAFYDAAEQGIRLAPPTLE